MRAISFTKLSGAGNDFILFDNKINPEFGLSSDKIREICDRRNGIGADGVIIISDLPGYSFDMKYFNADGSSGSLCGNGARCAIKYGEISGRVNAELTQFKANGKDYSGQILANGQIKFYLNPPKKIKHNFKIKAAGQLITASYTDTGSPHVVINVNDILENPLKPDSFYKNIDYLPVFEIGREIRYSPEFAPEGTNVNFIENENGTIKIRTYERGVENETLACGTGSVAAALIVYGTGNLNPPIRLKVKSGEILQVDFGTDSGNFKNLSLTGPAEVIYNGELSI